MTQTLVSHIRTIRTCPCRWRHNVPIAHLVTGHRLRPYRPTQRLRASCCRLHEFVPERVADSHISKEESLCADCTHVFHYSTPSRLGRQPTHHPMEQVACKRRSLQALARAACPKEDLAAVHI